MSEWPKYDEKWNYPIAETIVEHYKEIIRESGTCAQR